jgi:hypothetical protein
MQRDACPHRVHLATRLEQQHAVAEVEEVGILRAFDDRTLFPAHISRA